MLNHGEMDFLYKALPFFPKLGEDDLRMITATAFRSVCLSGEIILSKEKECKGLIIIKRGQLRAVYGLEDGREITLYRLLPRDVCILTASCVLKNIYFEIILEVEKDSEHGESFPKKVLRSRNFPYPSYPSAFRKSFGLWIR